MAVVDVYTLLTLPSSKAFSAFRTPDLGIDEDSRLDSHPRKIPRLAADSDSASASRSRTASSVNNGGASGKSTVVLKLQGASSEY